MNEMSFGMLMGAVICALASLLTLGAMELRDRAKYGKAEGVCEYQCEVFDLDSRYDRSEDACYCLVPVQELEGDDA